MPNKAFKRHVEKTTRMSFFGVDEYFTSQKCSECESQTKSVYHLKEKIIDGNASLQHVKIHELRRCNNNECRILWNRDVNACRNIMKVFICNLLGNERPKYLCRDQTPGESPKTDSKRDNIV